jgi:mannonate dehydratase
MQSPLGTHWLWRRQQRKDSRLAAQPAERKRAEAARRHTWSRVPAAGSRIITYFLKAVIPVAEKANVRLALHPNDPPVPLSRGSQQIMGTVAGWKHLIEIVNSPSNEITFDCGVTREMGEDPVAVCHYFGSRDRINHVHYRNPHIMKPYVKHDEGFIDEGDVNMLAVMRELLRVKYTREVYPPPVTVN